MLLVYLPIIPPSLSQLCRLFTLTHVTEVRLGSIEADCILFLATVARDVGLDIGDLRGVMLDHAVMTKDVEEFSSTLDNPISNEVSNIG